MKRPERGRTARDRLHAVLRACSMVLAVAMGVVAVWLIVTTDTRKGATIGALLGFWAILLGAYGVFGTRRPVLLAQPVERGDPPSRGELSRIDDVTERREYEYRLAEMLRREVQACMGDELTTLRADVAALRSELVEKVGGQLRMERIETTRVIGSDIEALQHEVRQLMVSRQPDDGASYALGTAHAALLSGVQERSLFATSPLPQPHYPAPASETYVTGPVSPELVGPEPDPEPVGPRPVPPTPAPPTPAPPRPAPPAPLRPEPVAPEPFAPEPFASGPFALEPVSPEPIAPEPVSPEPFASGPFAPEPFASGPFALEPVSPEPFAPEPIAAYSVRLDSGPPAPLLAEAELNPDPFASMPRLRPFTDFEFGPIENGRTEDPYEPSRRDDAPLPVSGTPSPTDGAAVPANGTAANAVPVNGAQPNAVPVNGAQGNPAAPGSGRHANANGDPQVAAPPAGGRRRRAVGGQDDMLARILHREGVR